MNGSVFIAIFTAYVIAMILVSFYVSTRNKSGEDFLLSGRNLPFFLTLGTTIATMVGTGSSMGAVGLGYEKGWYSALYGLGGALGILLLAKVFASVRNYKFMTMSEELSFYVGANRVVKNITALLVVLACIGWLGAHIIGGSLYLSWVTGMDHNISKTVISVAFAVYVIIGGYTAVVWTDTIMAIVLFSGFILMAVLSIHYIGDINVFLNLAGNASQELSNLNDSSNNILPAVSLALAVLVGVLVTPSYRQRIYSGRNVESIKKSFYLSGALYLFFSFIPAIIGITAFEINDGLKNSSYAFLFIALEVLPLWAGYLVLIAGLSATMSSASSDAIAAVSILLRDVYKLIFKQMPSPDKAIYLSRIGLLIIVSIALLFALLSNNIVSYITSMISTFMAGMCTCVFLGHFWEKYNWQGAIASLLSGSIISFAIMSNDNWFSYWGNPVIPALLGSVFAGIVITLLTPPSPISREQALSILNNERDQMEKMS